MGRGHLRRGEDGRGPRQDLHSFAKPAAFPPQLRPVRAGRPAATAGPSIPPGLAGPCLDRTVRQAAPSGLRPALPLRFAQLQRVSQQQQHGTGARRLHPAGLQVPHRALAQFGACRQLLLRQAGPAPTRSHERTERRGRRGVDRLHLLSSVAVDDEGERYPARGRWPASCVLAGSEHGDGRCPCHSAYEKLAFHASLRYAHIGESSPRHGWAGCAASLAVHLRPIRRARWRACRSGSPRPS
jgi:hypothetical protein